MNPPSIVACMLTGLIALPSIVNAHNSGARSNSTPVPQITEQATPVVAVVEQFAAALKSGDLKRAGDLLADDVLILESGSAERSRQEYLGHHAAADAAFLKGAQIEVKLRTARVEGAFAWVGTESELRTTRNGAPLTLLSTETTALKNTSGVWRIVHIHWSSHVKS